MSSPAYFSSDTDGAVIYYTLNGAKPEPFRTIGPGAKSTMLYQEPFVLTPGKRTIKAIAVTRLAGLTIVLLCVKVKVKDAILLPSIGSFPWHRPFSYR